MGKIIIIAIAWVFLFSNLTIFPTAGIDIITTSQKNYIISLDETTEYWGLCIGPTDIETGLDVFIQDAVITKKVLINNGWDQSHILLLTGELDKEDVIEGISWLKSRSDNDDVVFIYMSNHGSYGKFWLKKDTHITYNELDKNLDQVDYKGMAIIVNACNSGSAILNLQQNKRVIVTSCRAWETSGAFSDIISSLTIAGDVAGNQDGYVSIEESFKYIKKYCYQCSDANPVISDKYLGELVITSYNKERYKQFSPKILNSDAGALCWNHGDDEIQVRQSFISRGTKLTGLLIQIGYWTGENTKLMVLIYDTSGICLFEKDIIGTDIYPESEYGAMVPTWTLIDIPDISITKGEKYFLIFKTNYEGRFSNWYITGTNKDIYRDGEYMVSEDGGDTWEEDINKKAEDLSFVLFGEGEKGKKSVVISNNIFLKIQIFLRSLKVFS